MNPFSKEQRKFSVCTPCHGDNYQYFQNFLSALNEQDYKQFEVIVVFDGPNEKGVTELKKQMKRFPKVDVKWEVQEWGGAPKARNRAAELSTGDFLTFLDPDVYLYPHTLRTWANAFELNPDKDVVWGTYDILIDNERRVPIGGNVPVDASGTPQYYAFRSSNYCSGANPVRKEAFVGWDETVKSLQDWEMWMRMLKQDDFQGKKFLYIPESFFVTEPPREGGISDDSSKNWIERVKYIREKNGLPIPDTCVCSLGAPFHGVNVARTLGVDFLPMPSFKPNEYKTIYLLGFYTAGDKTTPTHMQVFSGHEGKKIIHWIGTDVSQMHWNCSFQKLKQLRNWFKKEKIIHLTEAEHTHDEMKEIGINSKIVPIPPQKLYDPMPLPEKFTVAIYENSTQNMYFEKRMADVARAMPDIEFKFFGNNEKKGQKYANVEHLGWVDMDELIPQVSCNLRVTVHDGLPLTPLQFLTAGRHVVSNTKLKGAIETKSDRRSIIEAVREAQKTAIDPEISAYWKAELDADKFKKAIEELT